MRFILLFLVSCSLDKPKFNIGDKIRYDIPNDYVANCLGSFPITFTSVRTGQTHTVNSNAQCRAVTSDLVATEYAEYLQSGGSPILLPAKIKVGGCTGASAPINSRIQSVDGAMLSDFASIP